MYKFNNTKVTSWAHQQFRIKLKFSSMQQEGKARKNKIVQQTDTVESALLLKVLSFKEMANQMKFRSEWYCIY